MWSRIVGAAQSVLGLVLPAFGQVGALRKSKGLFWVLHVAVVLFILVGLYFLNTELLHWDRFIKGNRFLGRAWLSVLFGLIYALCWLAWWLFQLLAPEAEMTDFPDIDAAWDEVVTALNAAGIALADAPLFLVLGQSEGKEGPLFQAAQLKLQITNVPGDARAPLHVFANRDGIYITCPGASLLGKHSRIVAGEIEVSAGQEAPVEQEIDQTLRPSGAGGGAQKVHAVIATAARKGRSPEQLTEAERRDLKREERRNRPRRSLLKDTADVDLQGARLQHLCRLIVRDRWPFCPANGVLVLLPYAAADSEQLALDTGDICQRDLMVVRKALKVHCPMFAVVCDMETAPGFPELLERFTKEERQQRMGQRCPLVPALRKSQHTAQLTPGADDSSAAMLETISRWICHSLVPGWVFKKFRLEAPGKATPEEASQGNARLFLLLDDLRERQSRLTTILVHGLDTAGGAPWLFGGCYIAATGADAAHEQAFVAGVFHRLSQEQNWVSWTTEALAEEDVYQRWVSRGTVALGVLGVAVVGLGAYLLFGPGDKPSH